MNIRNMIKNADNLVVYSGIKSKDRVATHGEVYTPEHIVKDMMNMDGIREMSYELDKTFLEPACGNGNFLVEIIARKLETAAKAKDVKLAVFQAYSTVYGIDIIADNVAESKMRMLAKILDNDELCERLDKETVEDKKKLISAVEFIMDHNIILGNALDGKKVKDTGESTNEDFDIIEWKLNDDEVIASKQTFNSIKGANCAMGHDVANNCPKRFVSGHYLTISTVKCDDNTVSDGNIACDDW